MLFMDPFGEMVMHEHVDDLCRIHGAAAGRRLSKEKKKKDEDADTDLGRPAAVRTPKRPSLFDIPAAEVRLAAGVASASRQACGSTASGMRERAGVSALPTHIASAALPASLRRCRLQQPFCRRRHLPKSGPNSPFFSSALDRPGAAVFNRLSSTYLCDLFDADATVGAVNGGLSDRKQTRPPGTFVGLRSDPSPMPIDAPAKRQVAPRVARRRKNLRGMDSRG